MTVTNSKGLPPLYVRVHAVPHAKKEKILPEEREHVYTIAVREPAEHNAANKRIRELIAHQYEVPVGKVHLVTGHRSSTKLLEITQTK